MYDLYPDDIGIPLSLATLSESELKTLSKNFNSHYLVHVYGLSYTGKSTIAKLVTAVLDAHLVDENLIIQCIAYQITNSPTRYDRHEFDWYFEQLSFEKAHLGVNPRIEGKLIPLSSIITKKTSILASKLIADEKFVTRLNQFVAEALTELENQKVILISSTAVPDYLQSNKFIREVIEFLCITDIETVRSRFYAEQLQKYRNLGQNEEPNNALYETIESDFEKQVLQKDLAILQTAIDSEAGLITPTSYRIDTTLLSEEQVAVAILAKLHELFRSL